MEPQPFPSQRAVHAEEEKKVDPHAHQRDEADSDEDEESEQPLSGAKAQNSRKRFRNKLTNQKIEKLARDLRAISTYAIPGKDVTNGAIPIGPGGTKRKYINRFNFDLRDEVVQIKPTFRTPQL